ncbi:Vms1/Ankzf1 family peptidyl-tRNA hydrolase [Nocardioides sp. SYSU DS0651]|uniref:baeRF2 domain-containing protein n=1 Tax=Nocardioides sp. SYSU DS0651 TaxID=3415955 RepID=UPI003F4C73EC
MKLDTLRPIYEQSGPYVSLHLEVSRDSENAQQQLDARWTNAKQELEQAGLSSELLAELEERLKEQTHVAGTAWRTIVATTESVVFDDVRAGDSHRPETVEVGPLPDLSGWLSMADGQFPFLVVRADRVGADVDLYHAANSAVEQSRSVDGGELHITKVAVGGWAHRRFQERSENQWRDNAALAVKAIEQAITGRGVRLIVLAGDVRARADIAEMLGDRDDVTIVQTEAGGRAAGASEDALWEEVRRALADLEAREVDDLGQRIARGVAVSEGVLTGPDPVADAFVKGAVERLVLDLDDAHAVTVAAGDHPGLALPPSAMEAGELPADQVLVAAAALTDAEVSVLPAGMPLPQDLALSSGVAALLRWDDRTPDQATAEAAAAENRGDQG